MTSCSENNSIRCIESTAEVVVLQKHPDGAERCPVVMMNYAWPFAVTRTSVEWTTRRVLAERWGGKTSPPPPQPPAAVVKFDAALTAMLEFLRSVLPVGATTSNASDAAISALITGCVLRNLLLTHGSALNHCSKISRGAAGILGAVVTADHIYDWAMLPETAAAAARNWIELCDWTIAAVGGGGGTAAAAAAVDDEEGYYHPTVNADFLIPDTNEKINADAVWVTGAACALASAALLRVRAKAVLKAATEADPPIFAVVRALGGLEMEGQSALRRLRELRVSVDIARAYWRAAIERPVTVAPRANVDGWFEVDVAGLGGAADWNFAARNVLSTAIAFGPTVMRVRRTQSRAAAANALRTEYDRLRRYGADWDDIPAPRNDAGSSSSSSTTCKKGANFVCGVGGVVRDFDADSPIRGLVVFLRRPTPVVRCAEAVVWIRFSRV